MREIVPTVSHMSFDSRGARPETGSSDTTDLAVNLSTGNFRESTDAFRESVDTATVESIMQMRARYFGAVEPRFRYLEPGDPEVKSRATLLAECVRDFVVFAEDPDFWPAHWVEHGIASPTYDFVLGLVGVHRDDDIVDLISEALESTDIKMDERTRELSRDGRIRSRFLGSLRADFRRAEAVITETLEYLPPLTIFDDPATFRVYVSGDPREVRTVYNEAKKRRNAREISSPDVSHELAS